MRLPGLASLSAEDKNVIINYLILTGRTLENVLGLPLIPLVTGHRATLYSPRRSLTVHILVSAQEKELYGEYSKEMVSLSDMDEDVQEVFRSPQAACTANVALLSKNHVLLYLPYIFGRFDPASDEVNLPPDAASIIPWLVSFWSWMNTWSGAAELLSSIQVFHLLPTTLGTLRKVQTKVFFSKNITAQTQLALCHLGVPFLHSSVAMPDSTISKSIGIQTDNIPVVLEYIRRTNIPTIDKKMQRLVHEYFLDRLQSNIPTLSLHQRETFLALPIFPTLVPGSKPVKVMGPATGKLVYINSDCPLPIQPFTTYINVSTKARVLALPVNANAVRSAFGELEVLEITIPLLDAQPPALLDVLVSRILHRLLDLQRTSPKTLETLRRTAFVLVNGGGRRAPKDIIDPSSELASLYHGEPSKHPEGIFKGQSFLSVMQSHNFFITTLNPTLILERIAYISAMKFEDSLPKAKLFLSLLDKSWTTSFATSISLSERWLPTRHGQLCRPDECRDESRENVFLFDLVWSVVVVNLNSSGLREALGWGASIPFQVLLSQFDKTLAKDPLHKRSERVISLIKYLAARFTDGDLTCVELQSLRDMIGTRPWIPVAPDLLVSTGHAMLSANIKLSHSFQKIPQSLSRGKTGRFFMQMGCTER